MFFSHCNVNIIQSWVWCEMVNCRDTADFFTVVVNGTRCPDIGNTDIAICFYLPKLPLILNGMYVHFRVLYLMLMMVR